MYGTPMVQAHVARSAGVAFLSMGYAVTDTAIATTIITQDGRARWVQVATEAVKGDVTRFATAEVVTQVTDYRTHVACNPHRVFVDFVDWTVTMDVGIFSTRVEQSTRLVKQDGRTVEHHTKKHGDNGERLEATITATHRDID